MTSAAAKKAWESRRRHRGVVHTKINGGRHGKRVAARRENRKRVKHHPGLSSLDKSPNCSTPAMRTHWATDQGFTFRSSQKAVASFIRKLKVRGIPVEVTIHGADGKDVFIPKNRQAEAGKIWKEPSVCGLLKEKRQ